MKDVSRRLRTARIEDLLPMMAGVREGLRMDDRVSAGPAIAMKGCYAG
jgi:hypothetical protein